MSKYWRGEELRLKAYSCAHAYTQVELDRFLKKLDESASGAADYLTSIDPSLWCRSHFDRSCKSDHLTNNFTESFNSFIKGTRDKPICSMIMDVSFLLMKIMYERNIKCSQCDDNAVVPRVKTILDDYITQEHNYLTQPSGSGSYCVRKNTGEHWTLNLYKDECSCGEWQLTGIPCVHGVHLIRNNRLNLAQYCNPLLAVKAYKLAYSGNIEPIPHENDWPKGNDVVKLPIVTRSAGSPRKNRIKGHDEVDIPDYDKKGVKRCGKCNAFGHNSRICQGGPTKKQVLEVAKRSAARNEVPTATTSVRGGNSNTNGGNGGAGRGVRGGKSGAYRG